jgi:hypothetical protein
MAEKLFRILDVSLRLAGPSRVVEPIAAAYSRFAVPAESAPDPVSIEYDAPAAGTILAAGHGVPLLQEIDPVAQTYRLFLTVLFRRVRSHAVLHAAAAAVPGGNGFLIAAPSGYGKSSLAVGMVERGCRFLGDDYTPLELETGRIFPYPRAVSVIPGGGAPLPRDFLDAAADPGTPRLFGKSLVDVGALRGEESLQAGPVRLGSLFILASPGLSWDAWNAPTLLDVAAGAGEAAELERAFRAAPGVEIERCSEGDGLQIWRLRLDPAAHPTRALSPVLESDAVLYVEKHWDRPPDFGGKPEARQIPRREAAELLGREILNRRGSDGLMRRYGGRIALMFLDLAGALRDTACWRVEAGRFRETADLVRSLAEGKQEPRR